MAPARRSSDSPKAAPAKQVDKPAPKKEEKAKKANPHPPFAEIYILKNFYLEDTPAFSSYVNAAINRGADSGAFALPKGQSGKIKIASGKEASRRTHFLSPKSGTRSRRTVLGAKKPAAPSAKRATSGSDKKPAAPQKARTAGTRKVPSRAASSKNPAKKPAAPKKTTATSARSASGSRASGRSAAGSTKGKINAKRGASTASKSTPAKTTAASRRAAGETVKPAAKKTVARKSIGAKKEVKTASKKVVGRKPPARRNRA
ncbi:hypothetical protein JCM6882_002587 [Rhodosporidiobolus microsporus]